MDGTSDHKYLSYVCLVEEHTRLWFAICFVIQLQGLKKVRCSEETNQQNFQISSKSLDTQPITPN